MPLVRRFIGLALLTMTAALPAQSGAHPTRSTLAAADRALAERAVEGGLATALRDRVTAGFTLVWPGAAVVHGIDRLAPFLAAAPAVATAKLRWSPLRVLVDSAAGSGATLGVIVRRDGGSTDAPFGHYLAAWRFTDGAWRLEALAVVGVGAALDVRWSEGMGPVMHAPLPASSSPWAAADLAFARAAKGPGAAASAFRTWAAPDAVMFGPTGELRLGPQEVFEGFSPASRADWQWAPVAQGGGSTLGWTVGEAVIRVPGADGTTTDYKSKYLTLWRRLADGGVRFVADGGSDRP